MTTTLLRIRDVQPLGGTTVRLVLTDGRTVDRDLARVLVGPVFERIRASASAFAEVRVEGGTLAWPNGADLCPDLLIWGGLPPAAETALPATLAFDQRAA